MAHSTTHETYDDDGNSVTYTIPGLPARKGIALQRRLVPIFSSAVEAFMGLDRDNLAFASAMSTFAREIAESGDADLFIALLEGTIRTKGGKMLEPAKAFDIIYGQNYGELYDVLEVVIRHNFEKGLKRLYDQKLRPFIGLSGETVASAPTNADESTIS